MPRPKTMILGLNAPEAKAENNPLIDICKSRREWNITVSGVTHSNALSAANCPSTVTKGATPTVTTPAAHNLTSGQHVRFGVQTGMVELDGQVATVTVTSSTQFTIDINTTTYTDWISSTSRNFFSLIWGGDFLDANGELLDPLPAGTTDAYVMFNTDWTSSVYQGDFSNAGMEFTVTWDGTATVSRSLFSGSSSGSFGANSGTFTFGSSGEGNVQLRFQITDVNDPPRNIKIYETQYASAVAAGKIYKPDWVAEVSKFKRLRVMGWNRVNEGSNVVNFSDIATEAYVHWGVTPKKNQEYGPRAGFPYSAIVKLAQETGCDVHINIPHLATDACIQAIAEVMFALVADGITVTFEYSNECWNNAGAFTQTPYCVTQGTAIWGSGDAARGQKWYGYRSAQMMKIIRDVYGAGNREFYRGTINTQTVSATATNNMLTGVNYYLTNEGGGLTINDLFDEIAITGYFGDGVVARQPSAVTKGATPTVTSNSHGYTNGQQVRFFVATGMTELNGQVATVSSVATNTYVIDIDTTSYTTWVNSSQNYTSRDAVPLYDLMADSIQANTDDAATYPTDYTLFNSVMKDSWLTGTGTWAGGTVTTAVSVSALENTYWPAQKTVADSNGLDLIQYEGGNHFVGDAFFSGFGGEPTLKEFLTRTGHTQATADCYAESYRAWNRVNPGKPACKFIEMQYPSSFGTWGAIRRWPDDIDNPVWQTVLEFNENRKGVTVTT